MRMYLNSVKLVFVAYPIVSQGYRWDIGILWDTMGYYGIWDTMGYKGYYGIWDTNYGIYKSYVYRSILVTIIII